MSGLVIGYQWNMLSLVVAVVLVALKMTCNSLVAVVVVGTGPVFLVKELVAVYSPQQSPPFSPVLASLPQSLSVRGVQGGLVHQLMVRTGATLFLGVLQLWVVGTVLQILELALGVMEALVVVVQTEIETEA
jgi:hypothetical protein